MKHYILILFVGASSFISCSESSIVPEKRPVEQSENSFTSHTIELYSEYGNTIIVDDYNHPIFSEFYNGNTISMNEDTRYIFKIPIVIRSLSNLHIVGNGASLLFPFNGVAMSIDSSMSVSINDLTIENIDGNGTKYHTLPTSGANRDFGRLDISNSSDITINQVNITAQKKPATTGINYVQINVFNSTNCQISNCSVEDSKGELIVVDGSNDCKVVNNSTDGGWSGIATKGRILAWYRGYRTIVKNNYVYGTGTAAITVNDRLTLVEGNIIQAKETSVGGPGIRFGHDKDENGSEYSYLRAKNCIARFNQISGFLISSGTGGSDPTGIKVDASVGVDGYGSITIENNSVTNCKNGITVSGSPGQSGIINDNTIHVKAIGISIFSDPNKSIFADFEISGNDITSDGEFDEAKKWVVKLTKASVDFYDNSVDILGSDPYASALYINYFDSETGNLNITANTFNTNENYGIHIVQNVENALINQNIINNSKVGILLKCKNSTISGNIINQAKDYGILLWGDGEANYNASDNLVSSNTISVSYSAAIRLHNTKNISVLNNNLTLTEGSSMYAVYKSAYNENSTITGNLHNWPKEHN